MSHPPAPARGRLIGSRRRPDVVVAAVLVGLSVAPACASVAPASAPVPLLAPLSTSSTTATPPAQVGSSRDAGAAWAIVPMGHLDDPTNTFWQLFHRPVGSTAWSLVTPPGVADNGGLVLSGATRPTLTPSAATVGFEPSQDLLFSPLARTSNAGGTWSPGLVPGALAPDPDVVAVPGSARAAVLVRAAGGSVLTSASGLTGWRTLVTRPALAASAAGRACGVGALSALTVDPRGQVLIGTTCTHAGTVGLFADHDGTWRLIGTRLPRPRASTTRVLRLVTTGSGVACVVAVAAGGRTSIVVSWTGDGLGPWRVSPPLVIGASARIVSSGEGPGGGLVIETAVPRGAVGLSAITGPGAPWRRLSPPPAGTETVVADADGSVDALTVQDSRFTDWVLTPAAGSWTKAQTITVPIVYGSSG